MHATTTATACAHFIATAAGTGLDAGHATARGTPIGVAWPELMAQRGYLVRFAQRKLQDPSLAEDVVHDVFEAVLSGRALFAGQSALRSWLTGVLKHKIVDLVRQRRSMQSLDDDSEDSETPALECPQPRPDEIAEQRELLRQALRRIDGLPIGLRDAMRLRVLNDQPTEQVCQALQISQENLFVRLHRARKQLLC